jgi:PAS domain S-box-containing protein
MNHTILVVDDDPRILQTFARNLKATGHKVLTAPDGEEALQIYRREQPTIALVDVRMPHIDGFDVLQAVRKLNPDAEVILITGHGDMEMAIEALRAGASDFIPKPVRPDVLRTALQRAKSRLRLKEELTTAQEALRASEEHYRAITESAFVGVVVVAPDGELTFVNQAFAEMMGATPMALLGANLADLTSSEAFSHFQMHTERIRAGERIQYETQLQHQQHEAHELHVLASAAPLWEPDRTYKGTLVVLTNITERKAAELALKAEREKFKWVVELAIEGYVILNAAGHVRYANPQARLYLGLPPDLMPEEKRPDFLTLADQIYLRKPYAAWVSWPAPLPADASAPRYLVQPETESREHLWLQVDVISMMSNGEESYLVRLRDVTATIVTRNQMWSFEALINYKLRTSLSHLTGFLELLNADFETLTRDEIRQDVTDAYHGAQRLQAKIMDIFHYMDALGSPLDNDDHCAPTTLPEIIERIKTDLHLNDVEISWETPGGGLSAETLAPLSLSTRAVELILFELCENAKKFHPQGSPHIRIEIAKAMTPAGIRLRISDDGVTLSPEKINQIWQPYYQAESHFTGEMPGMGLGLAVVASLVWSSGGTCQTYNRSNGSGLVVDIILPKVKK